MHRSEPSVEALAVSPARLGPCRLGQSLGAGAFGSVHLAEMVEPRSYAPLGSEVAVKVFTRGLETRQLERFRREAEIGSRVDHVAVVKCFEIGQARVDGRRVDFLVMEYVPGGTLRGMMKRLGAVPENLLRVL
ncbi:MAG: protein kinase, partial [Holophagales bacterium]|nr:protein kinase [Holophagales bacterium]